MYRGVLSGYLSMVSRVFGISIKLESKRVFKRKQKHFLPIEDKESKNDRNDYAKVILSLLRIK
jgi:hypothetical protein